LKSDTGNLVAKSWSSSRRAKGIIHWVWRIRPGCGLYHPGSYVGIVVQDRSVANSAAKSAEQYLHSIDCDELESAFHF
jgi:hypothetical protein